MFSSVVCAVSTVFPLSKAFWLPAAGLYLMDRPPTGTDLLIFKSLGQQVNTVSTYPQIPPQNFYPINWVSSLFLFFLQYMLLSKMSNIAMTCLINGGPGQSQCSHKVHVTEWTGKLQHSLLPCSQLYTWSEKWPHLVQVPGSSPKV